MSHFVSLAIRIYPDARLLDSNLSSESRSLRSAPSVLMFVAVAHAVLQYVRVATNYVERHGRVNSDGSPRSNIDKQWPPNASTKPSFAKWFTCFFLVESQQQTSEW